MMCELSAQYLYFDDTVYMFDATLYLSLLLLTLAPGADTALIIRNSSAHGMGYALWTSLGICSGLFGHALLTSLGVSAIIIGSETLYQIVKYVGAFYLIYLGTKACYAGASSLQNYKQQEEPLFSQNRATHNPFVQGFLSNILNPKTLAFYLAFLPQFIDVSSSITQQVMLVASSHFVIAMLWQSGLAVMTHYSLSQRPRLGYIVEIACGVVLVLIGFSLFYPLAQLNGA